MELQVYYRILVKRWWILLLVFTITFVAVAIWTIRLPNIYATSATFVIRPRSELVLNNDFVRALDIVSRRVEINTTFAEVANSKMIRNQAADSLQLTAGQRSGLSVSGRVIGGTNVLEIMVQGRNPFVVKDFADAVGNEILLYISNLYDVFELEPLDPAEVPQSPIRPNRMFNLLMGGFLGLALGIGVVFLVEYVETPQKEQPGSFNIIDEETGAYNKSYFLLRLSQEMKRAQRHIAPLTLGLIRIEFQESEEDYSLKSKSESLRVAKILIEKTLREEDLVFRYDDDIFAVLLPEIFGEDAKEMMELLKDNISAYQYTSDGSSEQEELKSAMGALSFHDCELGQEELLSQAFQALDLATSSPFEEVVIFYRDKTSQHILSNRNS